MEKLTFDHDITLFYVTAISYPDGILHAHQTLHAKVPFTIDRDYFGVSRPENGSIVYRAAAKELINGEAEKYGCDTLVLKKGTYISLNVKNYRKNPTVITTAFERLLLRPDLDPQGYCVEWYSNDEDALKCMIRLKD